jgi:hypothetical protein
MDTPRAKPAKNAFLSFSVIVSPDRNHTTMFKALAVLLLLTASAWAQSTPFPYTPPITICDQNLTACVPQVVRILVTPGSLTISGKTAILATSGGDVTGPASSTANAVTRFSGTTGKVLKDTSALTLSDAGAFSFPDGVKQTFNPSGTTSGLNVGAHTADPSAGANGDTYYNSNTNKFRCYVAGAWGDCDVADAVSSVFGRTGAVVAATNDYTFAQIGSKPTTLSGYGITDGVAQGNITTSGLTVATGSRLLGKATSGSGALELITVGGGLTLSIGGLLSVTSGPVGGSNTQLQYNASSTFGGISGATSNGTTVTYASGALIAPNITNTGVLTLPTATTTLVGTDTTDTLTNKTITASTNVLGGVTMTLGSDANGDIYYRASSVLTRLAIGSNGTCLTSNGTVPSWGSCGAGVIGGSTGATDNSILRADGTGGTTLQNSVLTLGDTNGLITWPATNADKLNLYTGEDFGIGVQTNRMEIHTDAVASPLFFGHGAGGAMTDTFAVSSTTFSAEAKGYSTTVPTLGITSLANSTVDLVQATNTVDDTSTVANLATLTTNSNGTAAAGFGQSTTYALESNTTNGRTAALNNVYWKTATDASRSAVYSISTTDTATTSERYIIAPRLALTDNVATTLFSVNIPNNSAAGGVVKVTVRAVNNTSPTSALWSGVIAWGGVTSGSTVTGSASVLGTPVNVNDGGGQTIAFTAGTSVSANTLNVRITVDVAVAPTAGEFYAVFQIENNKENTITLT